MSVKEEYQKVLVKALFSLLLFCLSVCFVSLCVVIVPGLQEGPVLVMKDFAN